MIPKFKIGDKVKTLKGGYIGKEYIIEKIGFNYYKDELVYSGSGSDFYDYELELVSTSEQQAVNKFKEELRQKIIEQIEISKQLVVDGFISSQQDKDFYRAMNYIISILESEEK